MGFGDTIKNALAIVQLNRSMMQSLAKEHRAFGIGMLIVVLAGVASSIGQLRDFSVLVAILNIPSKVVTHLLASFVTVGILHLFAKLLKGKASYGELYRVISHAYILYWVTIIPVSFISGILGILATLWGLVVIVVTMESLYGLSRTRAIVVMLFTVAVGVIVALVLAAILYLVGVSILGP